MVRLEGVQLDFHGKLAVAFERVDLAKVVRWNYYKIMLLFYYHSVSREFVP